MSVRDPLVLDAEPVPGVTLRIRGDRGTVRHFRREYGAARAGPPDAPGLEVTFGPAPDGAGLPSIEGGHKTVGWKVWMSRPEADVPAVYVALSGRPRWFALSLVQGYVVEPMLSLAAARRGAALLPAAAIAGPHGAVVLLGRSRAGKSSVCALALAHGHAVLGDDQVVVDGAGVRRFPRRMRFYDDLRATAPAAFRRLGSRDRAALRVRRLVRLGTRGTVAPSLPVRAEDLGQVADGPLRAARVIWLERGAEGDSLAHHELALDELLVASSGILAVQRRAIYPWMDLGSPAWRDALEGRERAALASAFAGARLERLVIPDAWDAPTSVREVARAIGVVP